MYLVTCTCTRPELCWHCVHATGQVYLVCLFCFFTRVSNTASIPFLLRRRVLPLPSTAWSELTGELFCHLHSHNGSSHHHHHQQEQEEEGEEDAGLGHTHHHAHHHMHLSPREGDCLLSDSSVILRTSALQLEDPNEALMLTPTLQVIRS